MPQKCAKARKNVTTKALVTVKEYGIKPTMLETRINVNKNNKTEKYCDLFKEVLLFKILLTKL